MKKFVLLFTFVIAGCSAFSAKVFDPVEYDYAVRSTVEATRAIHLCGDETRKTQFNDMVKQLNTTTMYLYEYEQQHAVNVNSSVATNQLRDLVIGITTNFNDYSPAYCVHKLSEVQSASRTLSRALSGQTRIDICDSNVMERYASYEASYKAKLISKNEFEELVSDLTKLAEVDTSLCSVQNKNALNEAIDKIISAASLLTAM